MAREALARGTAALERAHIPTDRLLGIANWVLVRQS
jgi:hypothetical protein